MALNAAEVPTTGLVKKTGQLAPIVLESNKGLPNTRATVAMARTGVFDSATSKCFVNLVDTPRLNYQNPTAPSRHSRAGGNPCLARWRLACLHPL